MSDRPVTSKPRGICRYYTTPRGCFAGKNCKFLHGETEKTTPYDKAKTCKFFAAGYCKRGGDCWFAHSAPQVAAGSSESAAQTPAVEEDEEDHLCSICLEKPITYGLLAGCSHIYCIQCIRDWRDSNGKSVEMVSSGNTKKCPLCRALSPFVTPSSHFYPDGNPGKEATIDLYKASMARVSCKHFQRSPKSNRFCPFGKDCFYQHLNPDGTPYVFEHGVSYYIKQLNRRNRDFGDDEDDENDEGGSPWLSELSSALEAIRASVPYLERDSEDQDEHDDWIASGSEAEGGLPAYTRAQEALAQLAYPSPSTLSRTALSEPGSPTHSFNFFRGPGDTAPLAFSPLVQSTDSLPLFPHPSHTTGTRFSTVVHGRMPDYVFGSMGDWNPIPWSAPILPPASLSSALEFSPPNVPTATASDLESLILHHPPPPSPPPNQLDEAAHDPSPLDTTSEISLLSTTQPPSSTDIWDTPAVPANESDPPLLTDGRGRVVWSTTPASRRGRGRAVSSALPTNQQHKARLREESIGSEAQDRDAEQTRSPYMVRGRTFPGTATAVDGGDPRPSSQPHLSSPPSSLLLDGLQ